MLKIKKKLNILLSMVYITILSILFYIYFFLYLFCFTLKTDFKACNRINIIQSFKYSRFLLNILYDRKKEYN